MTLSDIERALEIFREAPEIMTAREYLSLVSKELGIPVSRAKRILKTLVEHQEICYENLYGASMVRPSFARPVKMTEHFFIRPPNMQSHAGPDQTDILIHPGISFGSGSHPTTRLSLEAIDWLFYTSPVSMPLADTCCAGDIGTGSGVLAIAMCLCGVHECTAWDIDPVAVSEAKKNIQANNLSEKITVIHDGFSPAPTQFSLICANLRLPTLKQMAPAMGRRILPDGILILSGILKEELKGLVDWYAQTGFSPIWTKQEKKWAGLILKNNPDGCPGAG